jgi:hypothetical protein
MIHVYFTQEEVEALTEEGYIACEEACHPWIQAQCAGGFIEGVMYMAAIGAVHEHHITGEAVIHLGEYEYHAHEGWIQ